jgi:hypothetical protein
MECEVEWPRVAPVLREWSWSHRSRTKTIVLCIQIEDCHVQGFQITRMLGVVQIVVGPTLGCEAERLTIHASIKREIGIRVTNLKPTQLTTVTGFLG